MSEKSVQQKVERVVPNALGGLPGQASALGTTRSTLDWGRTPYREARQRQEDLVARRVAGEIGDTLVFTEHDPVFTLGLRGGAEDHLVWDAARLSREGVEVVKTNRGGDITYHGPGQVVGYPIVSLVAHKDLHAYLRLIEQVLINALGRLGLAAERRSGKTGIWIGTRKIAAIGVAVRRWVAYHGFALNVDPDLAHFSGIVPCGIDASQGTVTSLCAELGRPADPAEVKTVVAEEFWAEWEKFLAVGWKPASPLSPVGKEPRRGSRRS